MNTAELDYEIKQDVIAELRFAQERYAKVEREYANHRSADVRLQAEMCGAKARRYSQLADRAEREFATADVLTSTWAARVEQHHNRYLRTKVVLGGPALNAMASLIIEHLADAVRGDGELVDAWDTYTTARLNLDLAEEEGYDGPDVSYLVDEEAGALGVLLAGLPRALCLTLPDANTVATLLEETGGRVGIERNVA